MSDAPIQHVSDTALWVASYRADETERKDALFKDPLASLLVGERGRFIAKSMRGSESVRWAVVIRTCIIDDYIQRAIAQGVDTILNLGTGLDTRPYRMSLPQSLRWIEIDYPHIIELKEEKLKTETPQCRLERIKLDLSQVAERRKIFSEINAQSKKVMVITEGVTPYLSEEETASLAVDLKSQTKFQLWILDYFSSRFTKYMRMSGRFRWQLRNAPFKFRPKDWTQFFEGQGWRIKELRYTSEEAERLNRPFPLPAWVNLLRKALISTRRETAFNHMFGYALLEPNQKSQR